MNKTIKWILISLVSLATLLFIGYEMLQWQTKKASPEDKVIYEKAGLSLEITYSRPTKNGREIFGGLVPYGKVWRTGANEATVFACNRDIVIDGKTLKAGKYTLWTIPEKDHWQIIFNSKMYPWGVNFEEQALREPAYDILTVNVPVQETQNEVEQFTIKVEEQQNLELSMMWDKIKVSLLISQI